jgi:hypothetical protein
VRAIENPALYEKFGVKLDRKVLIEELNPIKEIRNDTMHFDPEGIEDSQLETLRRIATFLRELRYANLLGYRGQKNQTTSS